MSLYDRLHPEHAPEADDRPVHAVTEQGRTFTVPCAGDACVFHAPGIYRRPVVQSPFTRAALRGDLPAKVTR